MGTSSSTINAACDMERNVTTSAAFRANQMFVCGAIATTCGIDATLTECGASL